MTGPFRAGDGGGWGKKACGGGGGVKELDDYKSKHLWASKDGIAEIVCWCFSELCI